MRIAHARNVIRASFLARPMVLKGFSHRLLRIDLGSCSARTETIPAEVPDLYLGAKGIGAYYLATSLKGGEDPLGPENRLIFAIGPYQNSRVSSSGRMAVITKSPLTGIFIDSYIGGDFAHVLARTRHDIVIFEGAAEAPTSVHITAEGVDFRDASALWGKGTQETERTLKDGVKQREVISIGPAGENLVRFASPITAKRRAAGRGGTGAVFGSKQLKAVCVEGEGSFEPAEPAIYQDLTKAVNQTIGENRKAGGGFYKYGTTRSPGFASKTSRLPTRNYSDTSFAGITPLTGEVFMEERDVRLSACCTPCLIACEGNIAGVGRGEKRGDRPEHETIALLGSNLGIDSMESVMDSNHLCNDMGMDTISTGAAVAFAIEVAKNGRWEGEDNDMDWGDIGIPERLIPMIARRQGLGNTLAEGVRRAAAILGGEATQWTAECKGLELPAWDPRGKLGSAMQYITSDVGANHMRGVAESRHIPDRSAVELMPALIKEQNINTALFSYILCSFARGDVGGKRSLELYNAITGAGLGFADQMERTERIWTLIRQFNVREGISRKDDILSHRLMNDRVQTGIAKGMTAFVDAKDLDDCLDSYYELRGWDDDGLPTRETLGRLGISFG